MSDTAQDGPEPPPARAADLVANIKTLESELLVLRKQRQAAQRHAAERGNIETALDRTARDRSARSSPEIEQHRARVQHLLDELVGVWSGTDRVRYMADLLRKQFPADFSSLDRALAEESDIRRQFAGALEPTGLMLTVPLPAGPGSDEKQSNG